MHPALSTLPSNPVPWSADWVWGCPLIVLTVIIHVVGLGLIARLDVASYGEGLHYHQRVATGAVILAATTVFATVLHGFEAGVWAISYCFIGALPDFKSAMLYSLGAMTTYGHDVLALQTHWRMLGAIEALNGWLLFGLSGAFLFWIIQTLWSTPQRQQPTT
jgi:hypothetical protein